MTQQDAAISSKQLNATARYRNYLYPAGKKLSRNVGSSVFVRHFSMDLFIGELALFPENVTVACHMEDVQVGKLLWATKNTSCLRT
jgi:hypothetical protein